MDDLDHSMHIAEYDWTSFYDESEELGLLQPSLAYPDNSSLSDSEDSVDFNAGQQEPKQSPAENSNEAESNGPACGVEEVQTGQGDSAGERDDLKRNVEDSESCGGPDKSLNHPEGNADTDETNVDITTTLQPEQPNVRSSDGAMQMESDTSSTLGPDPLSRNQTGLSVSEPHTADKAASGDASSDAPRGEKERWFVTVNDSPARQRVRATSGKKKRRQKKPSKNNPVCQTPGREKSCENGLALEITVENNESEAGRDAKRVTQLTPNTSGEFPSAEENHESAHVGVVSNLSQASLTSSEEDNLLEKLVTSEAMEPTTDRNKPDPNSSTATSHDTFTPTDPSRLDSVESDEFGDGAEFFSSHSYDSESYASASESVEEPQHLLFTQSSSSLTPPLNQAENRDAEDAGDGDVDSCRHGSLACNVTATYSEGHESTAVEPTPAFPSVAQSADKTPDDNSTCDNRTPSTLLRTPSDTPGLQKRDTNLPASGGSSGDRPNLPPVPDVTLTPCPVADTPEAYAEATGHTQPVYAISAFWDEMEKLTINDILQLRMGRSTPPRDTQETATPNVDGFLTHRSSIDAVDNSSSDGGLMDTSDAADSDYFTQPDEFKPDRSSCEFSTSDFEEEYWQFLGASRNSSPDPQNKKQQTTDSPFFADEEEESTSSEGKETPVPSEDLTGQRFEDREASALISSELAWHRPITKSKSVRNVQALNTDDVSLQLLLANDESGLFPGSCPPLEENVLLKTNDILGTLTPEMFLSGTDELDEQMTFPEVFGEYLFTEDEMKSDSRVIIYNPEDISVSPVFDYALCTFTDETLLVSLCDSQCMQDKPIPIFSCSPTVRELTFPPPQYVFLSSDSKEDVFSPIRVVSRSFSQGRDFGTPPAAAGGFGNWTSLLSIRKIRFHDKGSIWCRSAGSWVFPVEEEEITIKRADPPVTALAEGSDSPALFQLCRDMAAQRAILETIQTTRRHGIFATLKQSDMCLVCIAFASWVLRSSDPEAADAWKAALLANVSALSAIQYLRHYVKKRNQEHP